MLIEFVETANNYFEATNIRSGEKAIATKDLFGDFTVNFVYDDYVKVENGFKNLEDAGDWITRQGVVFETSFGNVA